MAEKTITVGGSPTRFERAAAAAITPGHIVELTSSNTVQAHSTAGGTVAPLLVALEDENKGGEIGTAYTAANVTLFAAFGPGDIFYGLLANGETAVIGSKLESYGDGTLRVVDSDASVGDIGVQSVVGVALEAVDMSGSSAADPSARIKVMAC